MRSAPPRCGRRLAPHPRRRGGRRGPPAAHRRRRAAARGLHLQRQELVPADRARVETRRDPALYGEEVEARSGDFAGSAVFTYKLNWQTVLFLGYGDERELDAIDELQPASRELFLKVSYAFQG